MVIGLTSRFHQFSLFCVDSQKYFLQSNVIPKITQNSAIGKKISREKINALRSIEFDFSDTVRFCKFVLNEANAKRE